MYVCVYEEAGDEQGVGGSEGEGADEGEVKGLHRMVCDDDSGG